jgi:hypothetical protein
MYPPISLPARSQVLLPAGAVLLAILNCQCILIPEDSFSGDMTENQRPSVSITGGVLEDNVDLDRNRVHFYWSGADEDGVVRWFEWAVDDTISEHAWRRATVFDDWVFTLAPNPGEDGFTDWHTFYIRAVDDDYARSRPETRFFNSHTIAPISKIEKPEIVDNAHWARTLRIMWSGLDDDAASADKAPAYYEVKHVHAAGVDVTRPEQVERLFEEGRNLLLSPKADSLPGDTTSIYHERARRAWKRVPGTVTEQLLKDMTGGAKYGFVVRAIDEAGAVERGFYAERKRNWVVFTARNAQILVTVFEPAMGRRNFDASEYGEPWKVTVTPNQRFRFQWIADASASGTDPGPCNYGFDIPDPDDPNEPFRAADGMGGWIGWAPRQQMNAAVSFTLDGPRTHYFYLKMRDVSGKADTETKCIIQIDLVQFGFTRKFMVVDDQRLRPLRQWDNAVRATDEVEDPWRDGVLASMVDFLPMGEDPRQFSTFKKEDNSDAYDIPDGFLSTLGEYQTVIWDCAHGLSNDKPNPFSEAATSMVLSNYVGAGGNMLIFCWVGPVSKITRSFVEGPMGPSPDDVSDAQAWNRFGFLWQYLHLRGPVDKPSEADRNVGRESLVRAVSADPAYPDIPLDYARWGYDPMHPDDKRGDHFFECLVPDPLKLGMAPWYEREEGLEAIYTARCHTDINHNLNDKPITWRTFATQEDLQAGLRRGRIVCFAFHPFYYSSGSTEAAVSQSLMWLTTGAK